MGFVIQNPKFNPAQAGQNLKNMETLEQLKVLMEELSVDTTKFFKGNKSAGTRARKLSQDMKALLQQLRGEILENKKQND